MLRAEGSLDLWSQRRVQDPRRRWIARNSGTAKPLLMEHATERRGVGRKAFHQATVDLPKRTHRTAVRLAWDVAALLPPLNRPTAPLPATSRAISR